MNTGINTFKSNMAIRGKGEDVQIIKPNNFTNCVAHEYTLLLSL